jgi:penicillin-binding protein 2
LSSSSATPRRPGRFLPPDPRVEEPYRLTPQLALRIAVLGVVVLGAFAVLFLRLWSLQVLSGDRYLNAAQNNQLRTVRVAAPRGAILDRNGMALVANVAGNSVQIWPADLPNTWPEQRAVLRRLSRVVDVPVLAMLRQIDKRKGDPTTPVVVKRGVHDFQVAYLYENSEDFRGVTVAQSYLRDYRYKALAAQLLGHVGEASPQQLERRRALHLGDEIGQGGVESAYDAYLRGRAGSARLRVDSLGRPRSRLVPTVDPQPGNDIRLTLDVRLQQAAERAIDYGVRQAIENEDWYANGGSIVALDPRNGEILAMASKPTYKPNVYVGRIDPKKLADAGLVNATAPAKNFPALNRAIQAEYPPGSTWKPVTALAAMEEHLMTPYEAIPCTPTYVYHGENGQDYPYDNWTSAYNTDMTLPNALEASCDTYFYELGMRFYRQPLEQGPALQSWASRLGLGQPTGVDLAGEESGLLPTPDWRRRTFKGAEASWRPGDSINLSIGQGDLTVTPLQMTRLYALIANGGKLVTPQLAQTVEQGGGDGRRPAVLRRFAPPAPRDVGIDPAAVGFVREGLFRATHGAEGTATGVFGSFPIDIAGKTGTAEKWSSKDGRYLNQSWWCGYGPYDNPELVVCAVIENGGHGGSAAAPAARRVFEAYFRERGGPIATEETD